MTLLHGDLLHLGFNMYALYLAGTVVERWYGSIRFLLFYLACAAAGSVASFVFGGDVPSVGASGAIFGLFGVLLTAGRIHHPVDRQSRGIMSQLLMLVVINIVFGFASSGAIDNAAHLGGLAAGLWIGALVPPTGVPTMSSLWQRAADPKTGGAGGGAGARFGCRRRGDRKGARLHPLSRPGGDRGRRRGRARLRDERATRLVGLGLDAGGAGPGPAGSPVRATSPAKGAATAASSDRNQRSSPIVSTSPVLRIRSRTEPRTWASRSSTPAAASSEARAVSMSVVATSRSAVAPMSRTTARVPAARAANERDHLVLRDIGVDEGQRHVRTQKQEALDRLGRRVAIGVGEDRRVPGIRPRTAMYGRLAWYRIASSDRATAIAIPVRAVVN